MPCWRGGCPIPTHACTHVLTRAHTCIYDMRNATHSISGYTSMEQGLALVTLST